MGRLLASCSETVSPAWRSAQSIAKSATSSQPGRAGEVGTALELHVLGDRDRVVVLPLVVHRGLRRDDVVLAEADEQQRDPALLREVDSVGGLRCRFASAMSASTPEAAGTA